jgi:hypothetical protein
VAATGSFFNRGKGGNKLSELSQNEINAVRQMVGPVMQEDQKTIEHERAGILSKLREAKDKLLNELPRLQQKADDAQIRYKQAHSEMLTTAAAVRDAQAEINSARFDFDRLEVRLHSQLRKTAPVAIAKFMNECRDEIDKLRRDIAVETERRPVSRWLRGREKFDVYSNRPSLGRRIAAVTRCLQSEEALAITCVTEADAEARIAELKAELPEIIVERIGEAVA